MGEVISRYVCTCGDVNGAHAHGMQISLPDSNKRVRQPPLLRLSAAVTNESGRPKQSALRPRSHCQHEYRTSLVAAPSAGVSMRLGNGRAMRAKKQDVHPQVSNTSQATNSNAMIIENKRM